MNGKIDRGFIVPERSCGRQSVAYKTWFHDETNNIKGAFVRQQNYFTTLVGVGEGQLLVEAG
ncbi:MAG: hypothetical protein LBL45_12520 [Treponema sp.]|nr:hypothetical protein [Treponema sp.]